VLNATVWVNVPGSNTFTQYRPGSTGWLACAPRTASVAYVRSQPLPSARGMPMPTPIADTLAGENPSISSVAVPLYRTPKLRDVEPPCTTVLM
jgi:hypothetical protein